MKDLFSAVLLLVTFSSVSGFNMPNPVNLAQNIGDDEKLISIEPGLSVSDFIGSIHANNPLPPSVTIFFPTGVNTTFLSEQLTSDPWLIPYHILPRAFSSCDLRRYYTKGAQIPTLPFGKFLTVTGNTVKEFTINGHPISHPDMHTTPVMVVHGVPTILNFTRKIPQRPSSLPLQSHKNVHEVASTPPPQPQPQPRPQQEDVTVSDQLPQQRLNHGARSASPPSKPLPPSNQGHLRSFRREF